MSTEYRIKAEKWEGNGWVPCRLILTAVFVKRIKDTREIGEIVSVEETR